MISSPPQIHITNMVNHQKTYLLLLLVGLIGFSQICSIRGEDAVETESKITEDMDITPSDTEKGPQSSDDADINFLFTRPSVSKPYEFHIGKEVRFMVGFKNKGQKDFSLNTMDTSFRLSQDFSYVIQNFSSYPFNRVVEPNQETTVGYTLHVSDQFFPGTYGFVVNLLYSDKDGVQYQSNVFNETITMIEIDEGLDSESVFLYIILAGILALIGYGLNKLYIKYVNPTRRSSAKPQVDQTRVTTTKEVDYDWLPPSMVANLKKTSTGSKKAPAN